MQGLSLHTWVVAGAAALAFIACETPDADETPDPETGSAAEVLDDATSELAPVNRSGISGTVDADLDDAELEVSVRLDGLESGTAYSINLYEGRCAAGGPVVAPLGRVTAREDGTGTLTSRVAVVGIGPGDPTFVQVETAEGDALACGDLSGEAVPSPMTDRLETDTAAAGGADDADDASGS